MTNISQNIEPSLPTNKKQNIELFCETAVLVSDFEIPQIDKVLNAELSQEKWNILLSKLNRKKFRSLNLNQLTKKDVHKILYKLNYFVKKRVKIKLPFLRKLVESIPQFYDAIREQDLHPYLISQFVKTKVFGQDKAIDDLNMFLYEQKNWISNKSLFPRPLKNIWLIGQSGAGKTYLTKQMCKLLYKCDFLNIDASTFTSEGYVGTQFGIELAMFLENSNKEGLKVVFLDEFDKLGGNKGEHRGVSVLNEILVSLDNKTEHLSLRTSYKQYAPKKDFNISNVCFILAGAFTSVRDTKKPNKVVGFDKTLSKQVTSPKNVSIENIIDFGFPKEIMSRASHIIQLNDISEEMLNHVLRNSGILEYNEYFIKKHGGPQIIINTNQIIKETLEMNLGVRYLFTRINQFYSPLKKKVLFNL